MTSLASYRNIVDFRGGGAPRLFTVLYFSVRSPRSSALCYGLPSSTPAASVHFKIKIAVAVRRSISKRSHEKMGDCEQSKELLV